MYQNGISMYAVITGDIVDSTLPGSDKAANQYGLIDQNLSRAFGLMQKKQWLDEGDFVSFRGDSFQCVLPASYGMEALLLIKSALKCGIATDSNSQPPLSWSCRLVMGLGEITYRADHVSKSNGPAFQLSGRTLDRLPKDQYTAIVSPWEPINEEFDLMCRYLDIIIERLWTINSARTAWIYLGEERDFTQVEMAELLNISQSAIHGRIRSAELPVIEQTIQRYQSILKSNSV